MTESDEDRLWRLYKELKLSGMMWEFHPNFTGDYSKDKSDWEEYVINKWPWIFSNE